MLPNRGHFLFIAVSVFDFGMLSFDDLISSNGTKNYRIMDEI